MTHWYQDDYVEISPLNLRIQGKHEDGVDVLISDGVWPALSLLDLCIGLAKPSEFLHGQTCTHTPDGWFSAISVSVPPHVETSWLESALPKHFFP